MKLALQYEMQRPSLDDHLVLQETMEQCILPILGGTLRLEVYVCEWRRDNVPPGRLNS